MLTLTQDQIDWINTNKKDYEFYIIHRIFHDPSFRLRTLTRMLITDFDTAAHQLIFAALKTANEFIASIPRMEFPTVPDRQFLYSYLKAKNEIEDYVPEQELNTDVVKLVDLMQDESYKAQWYLIDPYIQIWVTDNRARLASGQVLRSQITDTTGLIDKLARDRADAGHLVHNPEEDPYMQALNGTEDDIIERRSTGLPELDECMAGGFGESEISLFFSGTSGGKTVVCSQLGAHEAMNNKGYAMILATEVFVHEYMGRIVSNRCHHPIGQLVKFRNLTQMSTSVLSAAPQKRDLMDRVATMFRERMRIYKISPEDGLSGKQLILMYIDRFVQEVGHPPTLIQFDWIGRQADLRDTNSSADRAAQWERTADSMASCAEDTGISHLIYAQAKAGTEMKKLVTLDDIGIAKGIAKPMVTVIGLTNTIDVKEQIAAIQAGEQVQKSYLDKQFLCVCKSRKGVARPVPVRRMFNYQRLVGMSHND